MKESLRIVLADFYMNNSILRFKGAANLSFPKGVLMSVKSFPPKNCFVRTKAIGIHFKNTIFYLKLEVAFRNDGSLVRKRRKLSQTIMRNSDLISYFFIIF